MYIWHSIGQATFITDFLKVNTMATGSKTSLDLPLLIFRAGVSLFMIMNHGLFKMGKLTSGEEIQFADPFGFGPGPSLTLAFLAEFVCSVLIVIGLWTRWATVPLMFTMLVAAWVTFGEEINEMALLYFLSFFLLFFTGAGKYSVDAMIMKK